MLAESPLVSVGIPTFNRPDGLRRTLESIAQQSYKNLQIIISDNASDLADVDKVIREWTANDERIIAFRQERNIGPGDNFKFVLSKASGEYFFWAADDDEWERDFVRVCLDGIGSAGSSMTNYETVFRSAGRVEVNVLPEMNSGTSKFVSARRFIDNLQPTLFYGLHRRNTIAAFLSDGLYDFYDCYFVIRQILHHGYVTLPGPAMYRAGIEGEAYTIKPSKRHKGKLLEYKPFYKDTMRCIFNSNVLTRRERISLGWQLTMRVLKLFVRYEATHQPGATFISRKVLYFMRFMEYRAGRLVGSSKTS